MLILLPITSVEAERMFSQLKIVKTKLRTNMTQKFLNALLRIRYNGPSSFVYFGIVNDTSKILDYWKNLRNRLMQF